MAGRAAAHALPGAAGEEHRSGRNNLGASAMILLAWLLGNSCFFIFAYCG